MNPLVCWGGLAAMASMIVRVFRNKDTRALFIVIGYLTSLVPWILITRVTFAYHYFPCLIFLVLAICHCFNSMRLRDVFWRRRVYTATAVCVLLFVMFYPALTGVAAPAWYMQLLDWIPPTWPF
jgi:dolichyl-phosphate-mannose--protein O-mannosyl transferase